MNYDERQIKHLKEIFRFTDREARFIWIVANATGYFLRRHIREFFNTADGKATTKFIEKLKKQRLIKEFKGMRRTRVYHLYNAGLYNVLDQPNTTFKKPHENVYISKRLMLLDFLIQNQNNNYIFKTEEKIKFFSEKLGISKDFLPKKIYQFKWKNYGYIFHFPDKVPFFFSKSLLSSSPVVSFIYLHSALNTSLSDFTTWLNRYSGLFTFLPSFNLIFVSSLELFQEKAEIKFTNHLKKIREEKKIKNIKFVPYTVPRVEEIFEYSY